MADSVSATDWSLLPHGPLLTSSVHWAAFAPLLVTALAIMGSPGPATISLTASGAAFGVRRSARYLAGIVAGTAVVLLAVAAGVTGALLATPALRPALIAVAVGLHPLPRLPHRDGAAARGRAGVGRRAVGHGRTRCSGSQTRRRGWRSGPCS